MTSTPTRRLLVGLVAVLALTAAACGGGREDSSSDGGSDDSTPGGGASTIDTSQCNPDALTNGVTDDSILLGSSFPQSGTFSAFAEISKGYLAYFEMVNAEGGVDGRSIEVEALDDNYEPGRTSTNAQRLVQEDEVFALFNVIGTPNNLAIWDQPFMDCVPNLFAGTGSQNWGDVDGHPFTVGSLPAYPTEAATYAEYLKENDPDATVAVLYLNNDFGDEYLDSFKTAIEGTDIEVVEEASYEADSTDVVSQITTLAASDADVVLLATTALACPNALNAVQEAGWEPQVFISGTCTSPTLTGLAQEGAADGLISVSNLIDPRNPEYADAENVQEYLDGIEQYGADDADPLNTITAYGWTMGALLVDTLERAAESEDGLNRITVMEAARNIPGVEVGMNLPGFTYTTGPDDGYPSETLQLIQYNPEGYYDLLGDPIDLEGETAQYRTGSYQGE